jgi:hypothetical protein
LSSEKDHFSLFPLKMNNVFIWNFLRVFRCHTDQFYTVLYIFNKKIAVFKGVGVVPQWPINSDSECSDIIELKKKKTAAMIIFHPRQ